ncbi:unnamed protein product [Urochloa humidicola]
MWAWILFKELINLKAPFGQEFMNITIVIKFKIETKVVAQLMTSCMCIVQGRRQEAQEFCLNALLENSEGQA